MGNATRIRKPVKPVSGVCRWIKRIEPPEPGILQINGTPYTVIPLTNGQSEQVEGYRLVKPDGTTYDVDAHWWTGDCPDASYRHADIED